MEWRAPGLYRFAHSVTSKLGDGASVGLVCPNGEEFFTPGWWAGEIDRELRCGTLDLTPWLVNRSLCGLVAEKFGLDYLDGHWEVFQESGVLGSQCFIVDSRADGVAGLEMLSRHAAAVQAIDPVYRTTLLVLLPETVTESDDGRWRRFDWLGALTRTDVLAVVESAGVYDPIRAEMITEIARWDLQLATELADRWDGTLDGAVELIAPKIVALPERTKKVQLRRFLGEPLPVRVDAALYRAGLTQYWAGNVDIHIAVDDGRPIEERVRTQMWLGQVRAVFPELERRRIEIAEQAHRSAAKSPSKLVQFTLDEIMDLDIGNLNRCVRVNPSAIRLGRSIREELGTVWQARNDLAHRDLVGRRELRLLGLS